MSNIYTVQLIEKNTTPQSVIEDCLERRLINEIGGLKQFNGRKILLSIAYYTKLNCEQPDCSIYGLSVDLQDVKYKDYVDILPFQPIEPRKSRWDRFKQFVKGE